MTDLNEANEICIKFLIKANMRHYTNRHDENNDVIPETGYCIEFGLSTYYFDYKNDRKEAIVNAMDYFYMIFLGEAVIIYLRDELKNE